MIALTLRFSNKKEMEEWIDDQSVQRHRPLSMPSALPPLAYREEDALDKFEARYVLVNKSRRWRP